MTADQSPDAATLFAKDAQRLSLSVVDTAVCAGGRWRGDPITVRNLSHACLTLSHSCLAMADRVRVLEGLVAELGPARATQTRPRETNIAGIRGEIRGEIPGHPPSDECQVAECLVCGMRDCPHGEPMHYHHDGCPACYYETPPPTP